MTPLAGVAWLAAVVAMLLFTVIAGDRFLLLARTPLYRSADILLDRAKTLERELGVGLDARDRDHAFALSPEYLAWLESSNNGPDRFAQLATGQPAAVMFWYRSSPRYLVSTGDRGYVSFADPPLTVTGMVNMVLGADGKLYEFHLVPTQVESMSKPAPAPVDWQKFFDAAGLDRALFKDAAPDWTPKAYADDRKAWVGSMASMPGVPVRVDVASHRGWPVYFQVSGPWVRPSRMTTAPTTRSSEIFATIANAIIVPLLFGGAALLARRNVKRGRGDRKGANRAAGFILSVETLAWLFSAHHLPDVNIALTQTFAALGHSLFQAGLFWVFYLAVEPQVRKVWPHVLITWTRLMSGSIRDPLVGRDLLVGTAAGLSLTAITLIYQYVPFAIGQPEFSPMRSSTDQLLGVSTFTARLLLQLTSALQNGMLGVLGMALLRMLLRRTRAAYVAGCLVFGFMAARGQFESSLWAVDYLFGVVLCVILLFVVLRYGLFATAVAFFAHFATLNIPATFDASRIYFQTGLFVIALFLAIAGAGFYLARAGEPLLGKVLAEE